MSTPDANVTSASANTSGTTGSSHASMLWIPYVLIALVFIVFLGANFWCYHKKHRERYLRKRDEKRVKDGLHERRRITALMRSHFQSAFMSKNSDMNGGGDSGSEDRELTVEKGGLSPAAAGMGGHTVYNSISVHRERCSPVRQHGIVCNSFSFEEGKTSPSNQSSVVFPTSPASFESDRVSPMQGKGKGGNTVCNNVSSEKGKALLVRQKEVVSHSISISDCRLSPVVESSPLVKRYGYSSTSSVGDKLSPMERKDPVVGLHQLNSGYSKTGKVSPVETQTFDHGAPHQSSNSVAPMIRKLPPLRSLKNTAFPRSPSGSFTSVADKLSPVYPSRFSPSSSISRESSTSKAEDKLSPAESTKDNCNVSDTTSTSDRSDNPSSPISAKDNSKSETCRDCSPSGVDSKVTVVSPTHENNNSDSPNNNLPSGMEDNHNSDDKPSSNHNRDASNPSQPLGHEGTISQVNPKKDATTPVKPKNIPNSSSPNDSVPSSLEDKHSPVDTTQENNSDTPNRPSKTDDNLSPAGNPSPVPDSDQNVIPRVHTPEAKKHSPVHPADDHLTWTNQNRSYKTCNSDIKTETGNGRVLSK